MKNLYLAFFLTLFCLCSYGQQKVKRDSLYSLIDYYSKYNSRFEHIDFKDLVREVCKISDDDRARYYCKISKVKDLFLDKKYSLLIPKAKEVLETDAYLKQNIHKAYFLNKALGLSYYKLRNADSVIYYHKENLVIAETANQKFFDITKLSQIYSIKRDYKNCLLYLEKGLIIIDSIKNDKMKGQFYLSLGETQKHLLFYDNAKENLKTALHYYQKTDSTNVGIGNTYKQFGRIAEKERKLDTAILNYKKAIANYKRRNKHLSMATVLDDLCDVYILKGDYTNALKYANQSYNLRKQNNDSRSLRYSYSRLGKLNYLIQPPDLDKSVDYLNRALKLNEKLNETQVIGANSLDLFNVYLQRNEIDSANKYIKQYIFIKDSLSDAKSKSLIADLDVKYQTQKKEKQLAEQKIATQEQELLTQKANTRNWLLALGLFALGISAFFIWKRYKSEAKAKQIISEQKTQIEKLQKEFHHRLKNDFRSINSFISLVQRQFSDTEFKERLNELKNRVTSMFKVHEILLQEDDITQVKAHPYLLELSQNVEEKYKDQNIKLTCNVDETETIIADKAIPFGIVLNEFVTNSYKYAFGENGGEITIYFKSDKDNHHLTLKDNGKGLPKDFNIDNLRSLGMSIIPMFADLHDGSYQLDGTNGVSLTLTLPKKVA